MSRRKKNWLQVLDGCLTPRQTGRLTVGRKLTSTSTSTTNNLYRAESFLGRHQLFSSSFYGTTRFINAIHKSHSLILSLSQINHAAILHHVSLRSILISTSYQRVCFPRPMSFQIPAGILHISMRAT
jgi:hypothetical protein